MNTSENLLELVKVLHVVSYMDSGPRESNDLITTDGSASLDFDRYGKAGRVRYSADITSPLIPGCVVKCVMRPI